MEKEPLCELLDPLVEQPQLTPRSSQRWELYGAYTPRSSRLTGGSSAMDGALRDLPRPGRQLGNGQHEHGTRLPKMSSAADITSQEESEDEHSVVAMAEDEHAAIDEDVVARAALVVESALEGCLVNDADIQVGDCQRTRNELHRKRFLDDIMTSINLVLLIFTLFETPLWCEISAYQWTNLPFAERCPIPIGKHLNGPLHSMLPYIPPAWGIVFEVCCLAILTTCAMQEWSLRKRHLQRFKEMRRHYQIFQNCTILVMWCDVAFYAFARLPNVRLAPFARVVLTWTWPWLRSVLRASRSVLPQLFNVLAFNLLTVVFFTWLFMMIDDDLYNGKGEPVEPDTYNDFKKAFYTMFQLSIGTNFPDAMIPIYAASRWTGFLFMLFISLTFILFTNLMLAVIYKVYQDHRTEEVKTFFINRIDGLARGFHLLQEPHPSCPSGVIRLDKWRALFANLVESPMRAHLKPENGDYIFGALDEDGSGSLDLDEFYDLSENLLMLDVSICSEDTFLVRYANLYWMRTWMQSSSHNALLSWILVVNVLITIYESISDIYDSPEPAWSNPVEFAFSTVYMLDVLFKLSVISLKSYWHKAGNRFDCITSAVLFGASALYGCGVIPGKLVRYLNILRMLKLVMLLQKIPQFEFMFSCIVNVILVCKEVIVLLSLVWIVFGLIGCQAWGGLIYHADPALYDSDFINEDYVVLNFNDLPMAIFTLFAMLVMSFSPVHADALGRLSPWYGLGPIYCLAYYFVCVVIVFNILAAFTIDVFMALEDEAGKETDKNESAHIERMMALAKTEGLSVHVSTSPEMMKHKMQVALFQDAWKEITETRKQDNATLHRMFTPDFPEKNPSTECFFPSDEAQGRNVKSTRKKKRGGGKH